MKYALVIAALAGVSFAMPANACDTHAHVFGPPDIFPYADERRYTPPAAPVEHYRNMQTITGLSRAGFVTPTAHGHDNRVVLNAIATLGDSARGIANINASFETKALQAMAEGGIRGARFHLMMDRPGSEEHLSENLPALQKLYLTNRPHYIDEFEQWAALIQQTIFKGSRRN